MRGRSIVGRAVQQIGGSGYGEILLVFLFTVVGLLLAIRRPRNPIGWLFLSSGVCFVLSAFATSYSILDYVHDHGSLPLGWVSLLFAEFWAPAIVLLSVAALLFPDGRPSSRTMRLLLVALLLAAFVWQGGAFGIAVSAIVTHKIHIDSGGDLYAIDHAVGPWAWWYAAAQPAFFITVAAVWLGWLLQQVPAYRRSSRDRRLQLKWLYGGVALCGTGGILIAAFTDASPGPLHALGVFGDVLLCALPLSVGIALLKFRLYDIDRVISRTVSYVLLTGLVLFVVDESGSSAGRSWPGWQPTPSRRPSWHRPLPSFVSCDRPGQPVVVRRSLLGPQTVGVIQQSCFDAPGTEVRPLESRRSADSGVLQSEQIRTVLIALLCASPV